MAAPNASFFFTGSFEEMGDQILGQPPPYITQQQQPQHMGMAGTMYDPQSMMALHTAQAQNSRMQHQAMHQQQHPQHQQQQQQQQQGGGIFSGFRRARADRQQERQIEQMFTQQGMQADWGSFFGSGRGGFQGM